MEKVHHAQSQVSTQVLQAYTVLYCICTHREREEEREREAERGQTAFFPSLFILALSKPLASQSNGGTNLLKVICNHCG